jgi:hypothetical protein
MTDDSGVERTTVARIFRTLELLAEGPQTPSGLARALNIDRTPRCACSGSSSDGICRPRCRQPSLHERGRAIHRLVSTTRIART